MEEQSDYYAFTSTAASHTEKYLWKHVQRAIAERAPQSVFELGCGNGAFAFKLSQLGYKVTAVDPSTSGMKIAIGRAAKHGAAPRFAIGNAYDPLWEQYGAFDCVVSLEVVEHVYYPRKYASCVANLLNPGGVAIVSTPYHGYLKNLALAVSGRMDSHFTALWDHGHIKFWSPRTIEMLFKEQGMLLEKVIRAGRVAPLAKSMICIFKKQ